MSQAYTCTNTKGPDNTNTDLFSKRQCLRSYLKKAVPDKMITELLTAAVSAPNAGNLQPWHFCVVKNAAVKEKLFAGALRQRQILNAPVVIVVCAVPEKSTAYYGARGAERYIFQDTAAATENILLAATDLGLGACWLGAFDEDAIRAALDLSAKFLPLAIVTIGFPDKVTKKPERQPLAEVTTYYN